MKQQTLAPSSYPSRGSVGSDPHDWTDPAYAPNTYNAAILSTAPWADPENLPIAKLQERQTINRRGEKIRLAEACLFDFNKGKFLNPHGKTGIEGRGELGKWGPNWAADVIVTKTDSDGVLWVLLCEKQVSDGTSTLCFPAGMVEEGQTVPSTLRRELCEEAVQDGQVIDDLFNHCKVGCVYAGHVDDWRNTDHAWIVTQAHHFHATSDVASHMSLEVNDKQEIKKSDWYKADDVVHMYASHKDWLDMVRKWHKQNTPPPSPPPPKRLKTMLG